MRIMTELESGADPRGTEATQPAAAEQNSIPVEGATPATAGSPVAASPQLEGAAVAGDQSGSVLEATGQPEAAAAQETAPKAPETPQQKAEKKASRRFYLILKEDFGLTDEELAKLHEEYDSKSFEEFLEFYNTLTPDWVYDPVTNDFDNPELTAQKAQHDQPAGERDPATDAAAKGDGAESAEPENAEVPPVPDDVAEVEVTGEQTPETQSSDALSQAVDDMYRNAAWKEFYKNNLPAILEEKFGAGTTYDSLDDEGKKIVEAEFKTFLKETFLPKVAAGEFDDQQERSLLESMKAAGMEWMIKGYTSGDMTTFMKNFFLQDAYRSGAEASSFAYNEGADKGKAVDVLDLKEICEWSNEKGSTDKNKENWMLLCALIYRQLQDDGEKIDLKTWTSPDQLELGEMKKHMNELFEKCVTSGKSKVNEALVKAFDSENGNSTFKKPSFAEGYATQNLIAHFQMMANHSDYTENFFR